MDMWNEMPATSTYAYRESTARLVKGQQVAVTSGEGQGWMANVVGLVARLPECLYRVELADGRHLAKLDSELEPLAGDRR